MNIWILISVSVLTIISGLAVKNRDRFYKIRVRSIFLIAFFLSTFLALSWGDNLIDIFPSLTFIDLAVGFFLGLVSGFFIAVFFMNKYQNQPRELSDN